MASLLFKCILTKSPINYQSICLKSKNYFPSVLTKNNSGSKFYVRRFYSDASNLKKGLILGIYVNAKENRNKDFVFTKPAEKFNDVVNGRLKELIEISGLNSSKQKIRLFYDLQKYNCVAVVNLGSQSLGFDNLEEVDEKLESMRGAIALGIKELREVGMLDIDLDPCENSDVVAEAGSLSLFSYDDLKNECSKKPKINLSLLEENNYKIKWQEGIIKAEGQNFARWLMEAPSNILTPTKFAEIVSEKLTPLGINSIKRDKAWAESKKMNSYLSVAKGSDEPPVFLELHYKGGNSNSKPFALVGKGITFDSGGICIKLAKGMEKMRADMGGAACVVGTIYCLASLKVPVNIVGLIPLCENMSNGTANKPGDVVTAMNGKTIQILDTDAEGRLILADALCYAHSFDPQVILDVATLTGAIMVALGSGATGVYTNSSKMWELIHKAGKKTGDRVWRMPLFKHYSKQVTDASLADLCNVGKYPQLGGSCTAAAFLKEFVNVPQWLHLDIAGVMENIDEVSYLAKGMTGRPTRTLVEFIRTLAEEK